MSGISNIVVILEDDLNYIESATIEVNCSGSLFMMRDSNCSILDETRTSVDYNLTFNDRSVYYLLEGSTLTVYYKDEGDEDIGNSFAVVKSLQGYSDHIGFCKDESPCIDSPMALIRKLCFDQDPSSAAIPNATDSNIECFQVPEKTPFNYTVRENDFYYFNIPLIFPVTADLRVITYNTSKLHELGSQGYSLQPTSAGKYSVRFPVSRNIFKQLNNCIILSTTCANSTPVYNVSYEFESNRAPYYYLVIGSSVLILFGLSLFLVPAVCYCNHYKL